MKITGYVLTSVLFIVLGFLWAREIPRIKYWVLNKIEVLSESHTGIQVKGRDIELSAFPPGIRIKKITVTPKKIKPPLMGPAQIESLGIYLNIEAMISGRFEIEKIVLIQPTLKLSFENSPASSSKSKLGFDWNQIAGIPIHSAEIENANIFAEIKNSDLKIQSSDVTLRIEKNFRAAKAEIFAPALLLEHISPGTTPLNMGFMTRVIVERQAIELAALKIALNKNYIIARALGRGDITKFEVPIVRARMISDLDFTQVIEAAKLFLPNIKLPQVSGHANLDLSGTFEKGRDLSLESQLKTENLKILKFVVGDIEGHFGFTKSTLKSSLVKLHNSSGQISLENLTLTNSAEKKLSTRVIFENVELQHFLENLGIHDAPLHMDIHGAVPCEGTLTPLKFDCAGELSGRDFKLVSKNYAKNQNGLEDKSKLLSQRTIVALKEFSAASSLSVDKEHIAFPKALLKIGQSTGSASGEVNFEKGFSFNYHTDKLSFTDVTDLAELKFEGVVGLDGMTKGNGHAGIIDAQVSSPQFYFENFGLGNTNLHFRYEKGFLNLSNIQGSAGSLDYTGQAKIALSDDTGEETGVHFAHLDIPKLDLNSLESVVFGKKVTLPFISQGTGSASLDASGPFSLSKLTYNLKSKANHVVVAGEAFENVRFNVHGVKGHAIADDVYFKKGHGGFTLTGDVLSSGTMSVDIKGQGFNISDFEHVHLFSPNLDGHLTTRIQMKDYILLPKLFIHGDISEMSLNQAALDDSQFDLTLSSKGFLLDGKFFNDKIDSRIQYPFKEHEPFAIKFRANAWDFSNLLNLTSKNQKHDYETSLTAKIDLEDKDGSFWKSTGTATINNLYVRHGNSQLKNSQNIVAKFDGGQITLSPAHIEGDNTQLSFAGSKNKKDNLSLNINGRVDLALLTFLTPFLRDMSGELSLSSQIGGTLQKLDLLGSAFIKNGYFKTDALPQPFESINADMLFSQTRILINHLTGHFSGGDLSASGTVGLHGFEEIPVEVTGDLTHVAMTLPEGLLTHGDFHFGITGDNFPYLMTGDYLISDGLWSKNFSGDSANNNLKRSIYLPSVVLQKDFSPLEVDIATHFTKGVNVRNAIMDAEVRGEVEVKGDPTHPILKGDLAATPGGKILFRETPFTIIDTKVAFNSPTEINGNLYVQATSRVRDWDVTLVVQGTVSKPLIQLSSSPPLSEKSIVSLLALGVTEEDENKVQQNLITPNSLSSISGAQSQSQVQGYEAGTLLLQDNPVRDELKKRFGVNVKLSQTYDDLKNVVLPRVVAEKQWSPRISTSVSRTVGDLITQNAVVEYKLSRHFSLLGSFEQRDYDEYAPPNSTGAQAISTNILGLDLQYQVEFK